LSFVEIGASVKERAKVRRVNCFIILLGVLLGIVVLSYETILTEAGRFLAPEERGDAEVVVVEAAELRKEKAVDVADFVANRVAGCVDDLKRQGARILLPWRIREDADPRNQKSAEFLIAVVRT